ncbi:hypothetical protein TNCV_4843211 [Trichonephila clavipes]|uniref:Uncharacterized protein n=1 Tax=Trichonephila clavipes TaxID=2585209 RepID=A0A8X6WJ51_TRICX|nr:hypothetical protein TNCV_4843211 [Trichonephila clavipes]
MWREPGTHYLPSNVREIDHNDGGGLMVWTGITFDGYTHHYIFERSSVAAMRGRGYPLNGKATYTSRHRLRTACLERSGEGMKNSHPPPSKTIQGMETEFLNDWNS